MDEELAGTKGGQESDRKRRKEVKREKRRRRKKEEGNRRVVNSFADSSRNVTNPEVVFTSLCAMIPGGIVKA